MKNIKKIISVISALFILIGCFSVDSFAVSDLSAEITGTVTSSKAEYDDGEAISIDASFKNNSAYILGELVQYVTYDGSVSFGPGCTEIDFNEILPGSDSSGTLILEKKNDLLKPVMKIFIAISRAFVKIRAAFNDFFSSPESLFYKRGKVKLGSVTVIYGGEAVEISAYVSYAIKGKGVSGTTDVKFKPISSEDVKVSEEDKYLCRTWFDENIVNAGQNGNNPAYNFSFGGKTLSDTLNDWQFFTVKKDEPYEKYRNGKYSEIKLSSEKYMLEGRVEAVIYENNATCEWTVYLKNTGNKNSPEISNFNAADTSLKIGKNELYASRGSSCSADDFALFKVSGNQNSFNCREGRSSDNYMPYFNISGKDFGVCLAVGWSGQWVTDISQREDSVSFSVRQETLSAALLPDEEIRSPLISLTFYKNENPVKGFNIFRDWVINSLLPENLPETMCNVDAFFVSPTRTYEEMMSDIRRIPDENYETLVTNFWIDAGWYCLGTDSIWDDRFGVWETTGNRFPGGIKAVSDYAKEKGAGVVLWYEEERLSNIPESKLYSEGSKHKGWILGEDKGSYTTGLVWNFGNPEALQFIRNTIGNSVKQNGITVYREDSNFDPLSYWEYGDKHFNSGRSGITENHYVDGHYKFIDYLFEDNPGLELYDCCASGGRRLDLEVIRRGVPMWRSDFNCDQQRYNILEGTQSQTYSASFWLPYTGTYYSIGNDYRSRTALFQAYQIYVGDAYNPDNFREIAKYNPERAMMNKNFYPISFGSTGLDRITAMQYGDESRGFAVIYKRENVADGTFTFSFSGLEPDTVYSVYDYDSPENIKSYSGSELMNSFTVPFSEGAEAIIIEYSAES